MRHWRRSPYAQETQDIDFREEAMSYRFCAAAFALFAFLIIIAPLSSLAEASQEPATFGFLCDQCIGSVTDQAYCLGFLNGVTTSHDMNVEAKINKTPLYCSAASTTTRDLQITLLQYCADHPQQRPSRASSVVLVMLHHAYPCTPEQWLFYATTAAAIRFIKVPRAIIRCMASSIFNLRHLVAVIVGLVVLCRSGAAW